MTRSRRGATLVELLVALLLLDLGLLTLGAMSAVAVRRIGEANRRARAAIAARTRVEQVIARPCATATSGTATLGRGAEETWSSSPTEAGLEVADSVGLSTDPGAGIVVRTKVPC